MKSSGYVVVRKPQFVGERFRDTPRVVNNTQGQQIVYCGVCRDPWLDFLGLFYDGNISDADKAIWQGVTGNQQRFFSAGVSEDIAAVGRALALSNETHGGNEIIFISNGDVADGTDEFPAGSEFLGFDYYVDGYGSVIRLGIFTRPGLFSQSIERMNRNGLFSKREDLIDYAKLYSRCCREANLEIIDPNELGGSIISVYRIPPI